MLSGLFVTNCLAKLFPTNETIDFTGTDGSADFLAGWIDTFLGIAECKLNNCRRLLQSYFQDGSFSV